MVTTVALVVTLQANLATVDQLKAVEARIDALDADGTRGLDALGAEIRSELGAVRQQVEDRTGDRFRGGDWEREDRRIAIQLEQLQTEIDRLREYMSTLDYRIRREKQ